MSNISGSKTLDPGLEVADSIAYSLLAVSISQFHYSFLVS